MIEPVRDWPPVPGYYQIRLVKKGVFVPVFIWFGAPIVDGEALDRSPRWCVEIDGRTDRLEYDADGEPWCRVPLDPLRVWPHCARWQISEAEYEHLRARKTWAVEHAPTHPSAVPRETIDLTTMKPIW
ncbi:MAG TPA: hypothetical protein VK634_17100 [Reyranella sp.]|nr:hypothetical protein [Reyranella sp.]HTE82405.1 hypothetical protein [Reyranella sp.]